MRNNNQMKEKQCAAKTVNQRAWVMFLLISLASFFVQFHRTSSGVIRNDLAEAFEMSATSFSLFSSMYFYPYVLMQIPVGILADRWGVRKTVSLSTLIAAMGTMIFAFAPTFSVACLGRAIVGIGVSTPVVCSPKLLSSWFRQSQVVTVSGIGNLVGNFGGLAAQAPLALLVAALTWRVSFLVLGIVTLIIAAVIFLFLKDSPESMGLPSMANLDNRPASPKNQENRNSIWQILKNVFANRYCWPLFLIMPSLMGAYTVFSGTWGVPYLQDVFGYSNIEASTLTSYMAIGMSVGSFGISFLSDQLRSRKKPLVFIAGMTFLLWLFLAFSNGLLSILGWVGMCSVVPLRLSPFSLPSSEKPMIPPMWAYPLEQ